MAAPFKDEQLEADYQEWLNHPDDSTISWPSDDSYRALFLTERGIPFVMNGQVYGT